MSENWNEQKLISGQIQMITYIYIIELLMEYLRHASEKCV